MKCKFISYTASFLIEQMLWIELHSAQKKLKS